MIGSYFFLSIFLAGHKFDHPVSVKSVKRISTCLSCWTIRYRKLLQSPSIPPVLFPLPQTGCCLHLAQVSCILNSLVCEERSYVETLNHNGYLEYFSAHHLGRTERRILYHNSIHLRHIGNSDYHTSIFKSIWSHSGYSEGSYLIWRIASLMVISPMLWLSWL